MSVTLQLRRTGESWRGSRHLPGENVLVHVGVQFDWSQVDFKDGRSAFDVRRT